MRRRRQSSGGTGWERKEEGEEKGGSEECRKEGSTSERGERIDRIAGNDDGVAGATGEAGARRVNAAMEGARRDCADSRNAPRSSGGRSGIVFWLFVVVGFSIVVVSVLFLSWVIMTWDRDGMRKDGCRWGNRVVLFLLRRWLSILETCRGRLHFGTGNRVPIPEVTPARVSDLPFPLLWMAPFVSGGGYCSEAIAYLYALKAVLGDLRRLRISQHGDGFRIKFWRGLPDSTREMINTFGSRQSESAASTVVICHSEPGAWYPPLFQTSECPPGGYGLYLYAIGRTMFETDRVSRGHVERLNRMDEIWVPTQFHVDTFARSGVNKSKVHKVVQPVDVDFFNPAQTEDFPLPYGVRVFGEPSGSIDTIPAESFVFLSIFKWEKRKGWDVLIKSYLQEFSGRDKTILYLLTNPYHSDRDFASKIHAFVENQGIKKPVNGWGAIHVADIHIPQEDLPGVYKAADVFVLPSRGEGWGRPHVEAMAMSLPVIATNWSGMTEYMTDDNSYPLSIDEIVEVEEGPFKGHLWAEPPVDALRRLMRHVFDNPEEARRKGVVAREDVVTRFSPAVVGSQVLQELWRIHRMIEVRGHSSAPASH